MSRLRRAGLALLLGAALPCAAQAQHAGHASGATGGTAAASIAVPAAPRAPRPDLGASAAVGADGAVWAVRKDGAHVVVQRTSDRGRNWSAPRLVNAEPEPVAADGDNRPKIAVAADGTLYVSWTSPRAKPYTGDIRFARSLDGGASFATPLTVHADRQEITHRFDALAVDVGGRVYVAWIDKRDQEAAKAAGREYRGAAIYAAISHDRGASFGGDLRLSAHSCECCRIAVAPRADGGVDLMWRHVFAPNVRDHALAALGADGAVGPLRRATVDDWRLDACPHHGPSLARDAGGRLHAVWFTQGVGREGVHYGREGRDGFASERRVGGTAAAHADLAVVGRRVAIAWKEFDGTRTQLKALRSDDGGDSWREVALAATEGPSGQPQVLLAGDAFLVFWHTREAPLSLVALP